MHLEITSKTCALCKHSIATNDHPDSTRLCEECRSLIQTILPKTGSSSFLAVEQARGFAQPQLATAGVTQPALAGTVSFEEDLDDVEMISHHGHYGLASFDPVADFDELQAGRIADVETEYLDEFEASGEEAHMPAEALPDPIEEAAYQADEAAEREPEFFIMSEQEEDFQDDVMAWAPAPSEDAQSERLPEHNPSREEEPARLVSLPDKTETNTQADFETEDLKNMEAAKVARASSDTVPDSSTEPGTYTGPDSYTEADSYQEATDPWDDPLPAWEHSRNEYPLYVGVSERKRRFRLKSFSVPAVLLAGMVAAYFIFQSSNSKPENQNAVINSGQDKPESSLQVATPQAADSTKPAGEEAGQVAPSSADAAADDEKKDAPTAGAAIDQSAETQWRHSLQALASPSADEAHSFAERLVSAGVPAYVISADIANRGRWFRVRVGGFNTAQEAQKFAAEARLRAKAAGVPLKDLNVVDYVKP